MKQKFAILLLLAAVMTTTSFATTIKDDVNQTVLTSFNQRFTQATAVKWTTSDDYVKASFSMNGQSLSAFFTATGDMMGVSRNLVTTQLPINLQTPLMNELSASWVSELFEFATDNETIYFITLENADAQTTLKGTGGNSWSVYKKTKKS